MLKQLRPGRKFLRWWYLMKQEDVQEGVLSKRGITFFCKNTLGSNEVAIRFKQSIISKHEEHNEDPMKSIDFGIMDVYKQFSKRCQD